ncbi:MFS transporter [Paenibacillus caui]|uniref:MFS transporter n=1 Tax=Paenibacillus caui TaxID=2873927 RepID=UPI001CA9F85F|nr:MFS transporter [Paenibacillus caui]
MTNHSAITVMRKRKGYTGLFMAGIVNGIGDRFSQVAMLSLILAMTGSGIDVGITMGIRILPFLLLAPIGGMLAVKLPRKAILLTTDLLRVPVALSYLFVHSAEDIWILIAGSFILAAGEAVYAPVRKSAIPLLVKRDELMAVNGLEQALTGCVLLIGAIAGGAVSFWLGPEWSFVLNAVSFLITAGIVSRIDFSPVEITSGPEQEESRVQSSVPAVPGKWRDLAALFTASLPLQVVLGFELLVPMFNGIDNVLISVYAVQEYHAGDLGVGLLYGAIGIGLTLSLLAGHLAGASVLAGALGGLLIEGLMLICISAAPEFWIAFALYIPLTLAGGFGNACLDTLMMRELPQSQQGPVFGLLSAISNALLGCSMLAAGWLLEWFDPRTIGRFGGGAYIVISLLLMLYLWLGGIFRGRRKANVDSFKLKREVRP